ncbi:hypothetical protein SAMN06265365_13934 [Tistlia consotensis]|uniref:Uncharacterized protein n=1 Tax=Tistlia consotensis USBA 355 TaxID=560819 RepID=A0A1Y6CVX3_9PROT|nr:hypothetical protein [Tistlia consotensis]SMF80969.1 hypothetical protein SAMN05428998_14234 [Tistlia consotensis USBA 355]SNS22194.1 hypothetical protein SAMN06265365_13934 [Tistlia consotensis]
MPSSISFRVSALAGAAALALLTGVPVGPVGFVEPTGFRAVFRPLQAIGYDLGSKQVSGYFLEQAATCRVTLMVAERNEAGDPAPASPVRLRLTLRPGDVAGLDSAEDRSLNLTCGEAATSLLAESGPRDRLSARQALALRRGTAQLP